MSTGLHMRSLRSYGLAVKPVPRKLQAEPGGPTAAPAAGNGAWRPCIGAARADVAVAAAGSSAWIPPPAAELRSLRADAAAPRNLQAALLPAYGRGTAAPHVAADGTGQLLGGSARGHLLVAASTSRTSGRPPVDADEQRYMRESLHQSAKERVSTLLRQGHDNYNHGDLPGAVAELLASCPVPKDELATQSFVLGQGTWEVFWAPHLASMSSALGTRFQPIQYVLDGGALRSHVKYESPLFGSGWLSASGTMKAKGTDEVELVFDRFWVDPADGLRLTTADAGGMSMESVINRVGRLSFFPQLAVFPVLYLDEDVCVFKFPALNSQIAVKKVGSPANAGMLPP